MILTDDTALIDRRTLLALALAGTGAWPAAAATPGAPGTQAATDTPVSLTLQATLRHWLYLPPGYAEQAERRWPLIVFLHGAGERGHEMQRVKAHGLPKLLDAGLAAPAIVVSPQCDDDLDWDPHLLHALLLVLRNRLRIDPQRVTVTGLSMGGAGCWDWAMSYPEDLAGIAPVCGYGRALRVARMRPIPVRAYHGSDDTVVRPDEQRELVAALRMGGGDADLTIYPGVGHDAWIPAYADPGLLPWLLARRRAV
jgi:predicted peptidase